MTITGGRYDDPNFVMRQVLLLPVTTAGAAGTSATTIHSYPYPVRIRRITSVVQVAGTTTGAGINLINLNGTTTTTAGSLVLGTAAANSVGTSADLNFTVPAGSICYLTNGADATVVARTTTLEYHLDPQATWDAT